MFTISPVIDHLFIGNIDSINPHVLKQYNIKAIVSIVGDEVKVMYPSDTNFIRIGLLDHESQNIEPWLEPGYHFINSHRLSKKNVLVHCQAGVSRSATMVLYYLMKHFRVPLRIALGHLREKRPIVRPNPGFLRTLSNYSIQHHGTI